MLRTAGCRAVFAALVAPLVVVAWASTASAQAFLPPKGEGSVSLLYQGMFVKDHFFATKAVDAGQITSRGLLLDFTYSVSDRVAISFGLPGVTAMYRGDKPHPLVDNSAPTGYSGVSPADDGRYHGAVQDFRFDVRYNAMARGGMALTPFMAASVPSHNYSVFSHTAPGQHLKQLAFGISAAKQDAGLPGLFVQGRYAYAIAEKVVDISHNRSNADLEVGYFVTPSLRVLALATGQFTHGGIDMVANPQIVLGPLFQYHDQITRIHFLDVGAGVSFQLTDGVGVFGSLLRTVSARNGHGIDHALSIGASWSFSTRRAGDRAITSADRALARCLCEKSGS